MKKTSIFILILGFTLLFSQNQTLAINKTLELEKTDSLHQDFDKPAVYPGGINAFKNNFSRTFNAGKINARGKIKSEAQFAVSKEGIITDIVITGGNKSMNKEMERTLKTMSQTKWKPAELKGQPVKCKLRFPLTMSFE